jgi:hypothetical protein
MPLKLNDVFFNLCGSKRIDSVADRIILDGKTCGSCDSGKFGLRKNSSYSSDGFVWKCSNKACHKRISIRIVSWFKNHRLTLEKVLLLTYFRVYIGWGVECQRQGALNTDVATEYPSSYIQYVSHIVRMLHNVKTKVNTTNIGVMRS